MTGENHESHFENGSSGRLGDAKAGSITDSVAAPLARYLDGTTGDPEKNTFGYVGVDLVLQPRPANLLSQASQYVGARTGNEEMETFARVEVQPLLAADIRKQKSNR